MCNAFSAIVGRNRKVYWKLGIDEHEGLRKEFKLKYTENLCPIEINPNNDDYIFPDKWNFKFDDKIPDWWKQSHEKASWDAHKRWNKELRKKVHINRLRNIIHPFKLPKVNKPTKTDLNNLKEWDSVWDSVWASVLASVWASVWNSVGNSVWASVGDSVWDSVLDSVGASVLDSVGTSVWAYIGWNFNLKRSEWKYTKQIKTKDYPFMPLIKLWKRGIVPSFDGRVWRLHSGKKADIIFEISREELSK